MPKKGMQYDYKKAYDKNLPMSERFHYLENARHDQDSGSPNNFLGGITAGIVGAARGGALNRFLESSVGQAAQQAAGAAPVAPTADVSAGAAMGGGTMDPTNPFEGKTFKIEPASPMGMVDPELSSVGIDASQTFQPPMASNEMGGAKDLFGDKTRGIAETIYGSAVQRQASVKTPLGMSPLQGNAFIKAKIDAEKAGASTFEVDGKTYNVK